MFWWTHGIFLSITAIFLISGIFYLVYDGNNSFLDHITDFTEDVLYGGFSIIVIIFGPVISSIYFAIITSKESTYKMKLIKTLYSLDSIDDFNLLSEDIQNSIISQVDEYMKPIWDNFNLGAKICLYITIGFVFFLIIGSVISAIMDRKTKAKKDNIAKIKYAYMQASQSNLPEMKEVAKVLKKTLKKIELQQEMEKISDGLKAVKAIQYNDMDEVQKELDTILAMMKLEDDEINALKKKYDK